MALIRCPESGCWRMVSTKAFACPSCGFPLDSRELDVPPDAATAPPPAALFRGLVECWTNRRRIQRRCELLVSARGIVGEAAAVQAGEENPEHNEGYAIDVTSGRLAFANVTFNRGARGGSYVVVEMLDETLHFRARDEQETDRLFAAIQRARDSA